MKKNNPLLIAAGTLLFYSCVLPVADALSGWAQNVIASKVSKIQYTMAQDQQETEEIADRINGSGCIQSIGFQVENEEEE